MNYEEKAPDYFSNIRKDLINFIKPNSKDLKILEIGAAYGETLFYLKEKGIASECVGVDLFEDVNNKQNYKNIDRFIFGNIEQIDLKEYYGYFDLILLPDVLEHLLEPTPVLNKIKEYLKEDGKIIVSMPNIRHYSALIKIFIKGDFRYEESGIFDYTHMRFYCRKNIQELLEISGYKIITQESSIKNYKGKSAAKLINLITFGIFEEFFSYQYFFVIKK
ncbi:class I SAM-dependent methyltransferase [Flavobacterium lacisediminis]|uniref:Class I SAM-dependent methyltransferase n=1 Tax=Flavobacterium lacisediminis TaxID=2989705 RepID=A0ABT3EEB5_9FLAO|nr:class I SAM-dependent methyltransferase [Flavobacterium lacisediminis]MCW1146902.1 class I SAM-dependent methyltransferase [Flavobacterium lacisediminis]